MGGAHYIMYPVKKETNTWNNSDGTTTKTTITTYSNGAVIEKPKK